MIFPNTPLIYLKLSYNFSWMYFYIECLNLKPIIAALTFKIMFYSAESYILLVTLLCFDLKKQSINMWYFELYHYFLLVVFVSNQAWTCVSTCDLWRLKLSTFIVCQCTSCIVLTCKFELFLRTVSFLACVTICQFLLSAKTILITFSAHILKVVLYCSAACVMCYLPSVRT